MRINKRIFRNLILSEINNILIEQDDDVDASERTDATRPSRDSVDDQIDSFILKFEKDSIKKEDIDIFSLSESLNRMSIGILLEQEEEEPPAAEEVEGEGDISPPEADTPDKDIESSEDVDVDMPVDKMPMPPLDIDAFAKRVARLVMNHDTLLSIPTVIINRAIGFLEENYDQSYVEELKEIFDSEYDFNIEDKSEVPIAPPAVGAWAGGTGAGGGGGV